jgi:hypothetical protein
MVVSSRFILTFILTLTAICGLYFVILPTSKVQAIGGTGYFSGDPADIGTPDIPMNDVIAPRNAVPGYVYDGSNDKADFLSWLDTHVDRNDPASGQNEVGGAFIVNTMLGRASGSRTKTISSAMWTELSQRINSPGITMSTVTADPNSYSSTTSFYDPVGTGQDDFFATWNSTSRPMIIFRNAAGSVVYIIEIPCANPLGGFPGLPDVTPATIDAQSYVGSTSTSLVTGGINISAEAGNAYFMHRIVTSGWNGINHTVTYRVQQLVAAEGTDINCAGSDPRWTTIRSGSVVINGNGTDTVHPVAVATGWSRTTTDRICQRLDVISAGGATYAGDSASWAYVMRGDVTVSASGGQYLEPGAAFSMNGQVVASAEGGVAFTLSYSVTYTTDIPGLTPPAPFSQTTPISSSTATTFSRPYSGTIPLNAPIGGQLCVNVVVSEPDENSYFNPSGVKTANTCATVVAKPTVGINGGDAITGQAFASGGSCALNSGSLASIATWNTNATPYVGGGTTLAAYAPGRITGFATAKVTPRAGATPPRALAYANTSGTGEDYGGGFLSNSCTPDYTSLMPPEAASNGLVAGTIGSALSGSYSMASTAIASPIVISQGTVKVVYINGNLIIGSNINYANRGGWTTTTDIPGVKFIVRGNIYINSNVTNLDGIYIAQPTNATTGNIYTCTTGASPIAQSAINYFDTCNTQLTVNGVFIAKKIHFLRTYGSSSQGRNAEQFNYLPELWLAKWPADATGTASPYDSISGLPPVL